MTVNELAVVQHRSSIHKHGLSALGVLKPLLERSFLDYALGIEDGNVVP
jgi:hypothetical protein